MPVKKVKGGYKWGDSGKVYKKKEDALKQGRAIEANKKRKSGELFKGRWYSIEKGATHDNG